MESFKYRQYINCSMQVEQKLKNELSNLSDYVVLAKVSSKNYQIINLQIINHLINVDNIPGVYVTLNKPYATLKEIFKKEKIDPDMVIFIDAVTQTQESKIKKTKDCLFIGSPEKLSDISLAMDQAVRAIPSDKRFLFFDSLSTLLIYNKAGTIVKFIHFIITKMREWKVIGIIISLEKEANQELMDKLSQFCDKSIDFG